VGIDPLLPAAPAVPPRERLPFEPVARSPLWPTVLGVIAVVFGALGAIGACFRMLSLLIMQPLGQAAARQGQPDPFAFMSDWAGWIVTVSVAALLVAGMLLAGGIGLLRRAAWGRGVILAWVVAKMILVIAQVFMNFEMQKDQMAALAESGTTVSGMQAMIQAMGVVGVVIGILWGWALPVFMLIWLSRAKVRAQVAGWSGPAASASSRA